MVIFPGNPLKSCILCISKFLSEVISVNIKLVNLFFFLNFVFLGHVIKDSFNRILKYNLNFLLISLSSTICTHTEIPLPHVQTISNVYTGYHETDIFMDDYGFFLF